MDRLHSAPAAHVRDKHFMIQRARNDKSSAHYSPLTYSPLILHKDILVFFPAVDASHVAMAIGIKQSWRFVELHEKAGRLGRFFPFQDRVGFRFGALAKEEMIEHGGVMHLAV